MPTQSPSLLSSSGPCIAKVAGMGLPDGHMGVCLSPAAGCHTPGCQSAALRLSLATAAADWLKASAMHAQAKVQMSLGDKKTKAASLAPAAHHIAERDLKPI